MLSLHDRMTAGAVPDGTAGPLGRGMWARADYADVRMAGPGLQYRSRVNQVASGADLWERFGAGSEVYRAGIMATFIESSGSGNAPALASRHRFSGVLAGGYASWFENGRSLGGWYVDTWLLAGALDHKVQAEQETLAYTTGVSRASIEVGHGTRVGAGMLVTPQFQVVVNHVRHERLTGPVSGLTELGGTLLTAKAGVRLQPISASVAGALPHLAVHLLHDNKSTRVWQAGTAFIAPWHRNRVEAEAGVTWRPTAASYFSAAVRADSNGAGRTSKGAQVMLRVDL
jgi:outer membrane autotransporter protein